MVFKGRGPQLSLNYTSWILWPGDTEKKGTSQVLSAGAPKPPLGASASSLPWLEPEPLSEGVMWLSLSCDTAQEGILDQAAWIGVPAIVCHPASRRTYRECSAFPGSLLPPTLCPQRCPLSHLCKRFVFYAGVLCSAITLWLFLNVRLNLLQVLFDPNSMFYLQYKGLSIYPPTFTVCAHRACITIHN